MFALVASEKAIKEAILENKISNVEAAALLNMARHLTPTPWLRALINQYFYEIILMLDSPPGCTFFLEKQIINETMRCLFANYHLKNDAAASAQFDAQTYEIIKYIESHLYEQSLAVTDIAKNLAMSESSLLRRFKQYLGQSPQSYIKSRRLEDACRFIKEQNISVSESCFMVGYSDFASFSKSFKKKFGVSPSRV